MHPAFSVIFLTTLIGVGQGLFMALFLLELLAWLDFLTAPAAPFFINGSILVLAFLGSGLLASFFHLGRPERAWRSATQWRTSWLSREVIILPTVMVLAMAYGVSHFFGWAIQEQPISLMVGTMGVIASLALYICTGMIYACIRFLQEWATPLTVINYTLLGSMSGYMFIAAYAAYYAPVWSPFFANIAMVLLLLSFIFRVASLIRNAHLKPKSNLQTAIGVRHNRITQRSQGFMGGSFNTREFFHGAPRWIMKQIKWIFIVLVFAVPAVLIMTSWYWPVPQLFIIAFAVQYIGLLFERWLFFAQSNHPQNLYYQTVG